MAVRAENAPSIPPPVQLQTLTDDQIGRLRLGWNAKMQPDEIRRLLAVHPGRSVWSPETFEYAIIGPWRHRPEIGQLVDLSAIRHSEALIEAVAERCHAAGDAMIVSIELDEVRRPVFYERLGFDLLEEIVSYEWSGRASPPLAASSLRFEPVDLGDDRARKMLLDLDHASFPWMWWNSEQEFEIYGVTPGVEVYVGSYERRPAAYLGLTLFPGWGHLDRIAVHPGFQGEGMGQAALAFAVGRMLRRGARRIGLSTQRNNDRSRRLYERFGFRRAPSNDYRLYGRVIREHHRGTFHR